MRVGAQSVRLRPSEPPWHGATSPMRAATRRVFSLELVLCAAALATATASAEPAPGLTGPHQQAALKPSPLGGLRYDAPFFVDANGAPPTYAPSVPTGEQVLGYPIGQRAATHSEIERCFKAWDGKGAAAGNGAPEARARLLEHGKTWEGRTLYHMVISSPANIARLDELKKDIARLSDQREVSLAEADRLTSSLPAVAWMAYSIHGDETSGADAALALAYHLIAATDAETQSLLDNLIIIIDPLMNPDGRDRFLKMVAEHRAANPNVDDQSLLHSGYWPYGRTNHYFVDLNRDWIFATQPETRGRIAALRQWNPQLFIDAHEMGSQDTFLMSPSREPYNLHHPVNRKDWMAKFAAAQAKEFDRYGWRYYTGEWNEGWYPGYSDSWAAFRGAIGMLFEQARMAEDGVRRPEGTILTYRESVHHQAVGSLANLRALRDNKAQVMKDYAKERREAIGDADDGRAFVVAGEGVDRMAEALERQGVEFHRTGAFIAPKATDRLGRATEDREFPLGSLLVSLKQPDRALASTLLEFDPRFTDGFLERERRELLRTGHSRLYDITAWNLPSLLDAETHIVEGVDAARVARKAQPPQPAPGSASAPSPIGWKVTGIDGSPAGVAARLMDRGVRVRLTSKEWRSGADADAAERGLVLVLRADNQAFTGDLAAIVSDVASERGATVSPLITGLGAGNENPDFGSEHFPLLTPPRIAILSRGLFNDNNVGECWFTVDQRLGVRAALLDVESLSGADLRRYNVLIAPDAWDPEALTKSTGVISSWVRQGGTLIAIGSSAAALAEAPAEEPEKEGGDGPTFGYTFPGGGGGGSGPLTSVRQLHDVLDKLDEYEQQILREWEARHATVDTKSVWSRAVDASVIHYPWQSPKPVANAKAEHESKDGDAEKPAKGKPARTWVAGEDAPKPAASGDDNAADSDDESVTEGEAHADASEDKPDEDELRRRDEWNSLFMPTGAILAARLDERHWLTLGCRTRPETLIDESDETPAQRAEREAKDAADLAARGGGDDYLPVLYTGDTVLMAGEGVDAPIRFGYYTPSAAKDDGSEPSPTSAGWARNPPGQDLTLRMSGLLWPEAAVRLANSAFVTRERAGNGQVILFACSPTFRHATLGAARVFENAIVFGPGLGANEAIMP